MIIPIAMMFNDNYSIPASVAIYSLLANASKEHQYQLFVLQTNLSEEHKNKLTKLVFEFKNAFIKFIPMDDIDSNLIYLIMSPVGQKKLFTSVLLQIYSRILNE